MFRAFHDKKEEQRNNSSYDLSLLLYVWEMLKEESGPDLSMSIRFGEISSLRFRRLPESSSHISFCQLCPIGSLISTISHC